MLNLGNNKIRLGLAVVLILGLYFLRPMKASLNNFVLENTKLENTTIKKISGEETSIPDIRRNKIIVFWKSDCEPCHVELRKLNQMISKSEIKAENLIAVGLDENKEDIITVLDKESYQFIAGHDFDGRLARKFNITIEPTILFVDKVGNVEWATSGVSATLAKRIIKFLK